MSLLNDALKRAKDSQRQDPPSGAGPLPPIEARRSGGNGWVLALAAILFLAAIGLFIGVALFKRPAQPVEAAQAPAISATSVQPSSALVPKIAPAANVSLASVISNPAPVSNATPAADTVTATPNTNPLPIAAKENLPLVEGVIFSATHPVAIVNGRAFNTGDHVGDYQIIQILKTSIVFQRSNGSQVTVKLGQ